MSTLDSHTDLERPTVTLPELLRGHAHERGQEQAFVFRTFSRTGRDAPTDTGLSYAELDRRARAVAAGLRRRVGRGDRVALLLPHSEEYVVGFVGCLYAGAVAVPLHAPEPFRGAERMYAVLRDCTPALALTSAQTTAPTRKALENTDDLAGLPLAGVDDLVAEGEGETEDPLLSEGPDAAAYLQYTSGSTGSPSGVRVSHANLVVAARQITSHFPQARTIVSWVPFFHDMGLIYGLVAPLVAGVRSVQFSAMSFVQNPLRWLETISDYAADWTAVPNFGMEHCLGRSQDLAPGTDLSSVVALINGSEPVRAGTLDQFTREYAPLGLRRSVMVPCYGLAEATLAVTATPLGAGSTTVTFDRGALSEGKVVPVPGGPESETVRLVACGVPMQGAGVRIVGTDTEDVRLGRQAGSGRVGRVWARGPNNTDGYWRNPERTAERFREVDGQSWLDTGDLGFVHDGLLYLVGRSDNMFIVRGRNHYPEDIETTVRDVVPGTAAAFGDDSDGEQKLVVVLESTDHRDPDRAEETAEAVRNAVQRAHGVSVHTLYLVRRGTIPRTTSGKVQRGRSRDRHLEGGFGQGL